MRKIRTAIIGCGNIYQTHATVLEQLSDRVDVVAVCDTKPDRAEAAAKRFGAVAYNDYRSMLEDPGIEAVHICTPHYLHAQMVLDALEAGKYVLSEKPMAVSDDEAERIIEADDRYPGHYCLVFQNRYNDSSVRLKQILDRGDYGKVLGIRGLVDWCRGEDYYSDDWHGRKALEGGGVMINQSIHTLDLLIWLSGSPVRKVSGTVSNITHQGIMEVEDTASARIDFQNGTVGFFQATVSYGIDSDVEVEVTTEKGTLLLKKDYLYLLQGTNVTSLVNPAAMSNGGKAYWGTGHLRQITRFYECMANGQPFDIDAREGYKAFQVVQALFRSSESGQTVQL